MKNSINYILDFINAVIWPLLFSIGQIIIALIFSLIYKKKKTTKFGKQQDGLNNYINSHLIYIVIVTAIIFIPTFLYKYTGFQIKQDDFNFIKGIYLIIPAVCLAITLNLIINNIFKKNKDLDDNNNLMITLISSSIIGPILEELLFRGIVFNELKTFNSLITAYFLSVIIFALFHEKPSQILYSFIFGLILNFIYIKTNNLIYPIIFHISANTVVTLFINKIVSLNKKHAFSLIIILSIIFTGFYYFMYNIF